MKEGRYMKTINKRNDDYEKGVDNETKNDRDRHDTRELYVTQYIET